jgi:phosphoglycolate phosphatase
LAHRKPHPAPYLETLRRIGGTVAGSFLLGDTQTDLDTARAVGVPIALVSFGPTGAAVGDLAPDALLDHFADLPALAARLTAQYPTGSPSPSLSTDR